MAKIIVATLVVLLSLPALCGCLPPPNSPADYPVTNSTETSASSDGDTGEWDSGAFESGNFSTNAPSSESTLPDPVFSDPMPAGAGVGMGSASSAEERIKVSPDIGLCTDLLRERAARRAQMLKQLQPLGSRMLRETFRWDKMEPQRGTFRWSVTDAVVDELRGGGFEILALLMAAPEWASGVDIKIGAFPPRSPADFGRFVDAVVSRYKGKITYYELWNEPNMARFWGGKRAEPADFVALLKAGYEAGKRADPQAVFVMGGVTRIFVDQAFLREVIKLGGLRYCDIVGIHLYPESVDVFMKQITAIEKALEKAKASHPIWVTEVGWASREIDISQLISRLKSRGVTQEQFKKSVVLRRAVGWVYDFNPEETRRVQDDGARKRELDDLGLSEESLDKTLKECATDKLRKQVESIYRLSSCLERIPKLEKIFWYRFDDRFDRPAKEANFGLLDAQGRPKLSYKLLTGQIQRGKLIQWLRGGPIGDLEQ